MMSLSSAFQLQKCMLCFMSGAFLLKQACHYLKVKENQLCCLKGWQLKVNQGEEKASLP